MVFWRETVLADQALSLLGESQDLARFLLEGARTSLLDQALACQIPKITLHSRTVVSVNKLCEILDARHAELANLP